MSIACWNSIIVLFRPPDVVVLDKFNQNSSRLRANIRRDGKDYKHAYDMDKVTTVGSRRDYFLVAKCTLSTSSDCDLFLESASAVDKSSP